MIPSTITATTTSGQKPIAMRGSPTTTIPARNAGLSRLAPVERESSHRSDERPDTDRGVEIADSTLAEVEQLERRDDDEDLDGTEDCRLRRQQHHHHAQRWVTSESREADEPLRGDRRRSQLRRGCCVCSTRMRTRKIPEATTNSAVMAKTTSTLATPSRTPARAGPTNIAMLSTPLATALAAVSSSGVRARLGVSAAWAERNGVVAIASGDRQAVHDPRIGVREDSGGRGSDEHHTADVREKQDTLAWVAVSEHAGEGRDQRCRDEPGEEDEPERLLATDVVRVDRDRDQMAEVRDARRRPRPARANGGSRSSRPRRMR